MDCDLLIQAPRILLAKGQFASDLEVAVRDAHVVSVGQALAVSARRTVRLNPGAVLLPGLVDVHTHPALSGSVFGLSADKCAMPHGVTAVVSQGDAGSQNIQQFIDETVAPSRCRVLLAINLSSVGESTSAGCFSDPEWLDEAACRAAIRRHPQHVVAVAVNCSRSACEDQDPRPILAAGVRVARECGLPLMYGMRPDQEWPFDEQLSALSAGDLVTYCFRRQPHCIVVDGQVHPAIEAARQRGILFDIGHGRGSFDFEVAERCLQEGFPPDTISTDLQRGHEQWEPPHSLLTVASKLAAIGMELDDVLRAITLRPAAWIGREDLPAAVEEGMAADLAAVEWCGQDSPLTDTSGHVRTATRLVATHTWRLGESIDVS